VQENPTALTLHEHSTDPDRFVTLCAKSTANDPTETTMWRLDLILKRLQKCVRQICRPSCGAGIEAGRLTLSKSVRIFLWNQASKHNY